MNAPETAITAEDEVMDLFTDEDGDVNVGEALTVLVHVVAGLCCISDTPPVALAGEFAETLGQLVAAETNGRVLQ